MCRIPWLVKNSEPILKTSYRFLGSSVTNFGLKATVFGHFCAGEDEDDIKPVIKKLEANGIGSILDYAAENDVSEEKSPEVKQPIGSTSTNISPVKGPLVQSRTYDFTTEAACDEHKKIFEKCIRSVKNVSPTGFAAIKVTALGDPTLLERMSNCIIELHNFFNKFDYDKTGKITREQFLESYNKYFLPGYDVNAIFDNMDTEKDGTIDYIEWTNNLEIEDLYKLTSQCREAGVLAAAVLTETEREMVKRMRNRLYALAGLAEELGVRVFIDAEHSYFQPAIDNLTVDLQKRYNSKYPAVYGTYQMYLKDSYNRLFTDLDRAKRGKYKFALKVVRGAYMVMERSRTNALNIPDIIYPDIEATHANYNAAVDALLNRIAKGEEVELMLATHNQVSIERAVTKMAELNLKPDCGVYFGQLLGMSDHLTFGLGRNGFKAYKYVPYGKVKEVVPYLIRRAQENSGMLGGAINEINLVKKELRRRFLSET